MKIKERAKHFEKWTRALAIYLMIISIISPALLLASREVSNLMNKIASTGYVLLCLNAIIAFSIFISIHFSKKEFIK